MSKRRAVPLIAALLVIVAVLISGKASATPPVSWQPEPFDIAVPPGGQLSTKVTAKIAKSIPPTRITVTPSLAPYVAAIEPTTFPALSAGSEVTITVVFAVATGTPRAMNEGTLHLRQASGKGNGTQARPLPITLTVGNLLYPPDPGEAGKATLEGIDADGDGIRDDIQRYIELTYPDEPTVRAGLRQLAIPLQAALREATSEEAALQNTERIDRATFCLEAQTDLPRSIELGNRLTEKLLNTDERSRAYILYDSQLAGHIFTLPGLSEITASLCE